MNTDEFYKQPTHPFEVEKEEHEVPTQIGPYQIESLIEKGGMSYLYLSTHPETKKTTAVKALLPKYLSRPEVVQRFLNEAEIIEMTNHPNIVKLYGHGQWEGGLYIAMEYIHGTSLRKYLLQNPISLKRAIGIIIDIAYALCHLHTHGVIHRDLKPENILVTETGSIKVIDFGIAQLLTEQETPDSTPKQRMVGTPIYISPEQRENPENVSYPSDIYSLGIIAYELILGKLSHGQIHLSLMPKGIQKILQKCLLPNPNDRYQDIVDFITDISAYLNSPDLEIESKAHDKLSELSEDIKQVQNTLIPSSAPEWTGIEIGIGFHLGLGISGVYVDFFELPNGCYGVFLTESATRGAEGVIYAATLRGMVRSLYPIAVDPGELVTKLNTLLVQDRLAPVFTSSYIILNPQENTFQFVSCGYGDLWHLKESSDTPVKFSSDHLALGIDVEADYHPLSGEWHPGDTLYLNTYGVYSIPDEAFGEEKFIETVIENRESSPQEQVNTILQKSRIPPKKHTPDRTLASISLRRKAEG